MFYIKKLNGVKGSYRFAKKLKDKCFDSSELLSSISI